MNPSDDLPPSQPHNDDASQDHHNSPSQTGNHTTPQPSHIPDSEPANNNSSHPSESSVSEISQPQSPKPIHNSTPQPLNTSTPQPLNTSTPQYLNTSTPQPPNPSTPQPLNGESSQVPLNIGEELMRTVPSLKPTASGSERRKWPLDSSDLYMLNSSTRHRGFSLLQEKLSYERARQTPKTRLDEYDPSLGELSISGRRDFRRMLEKSKRLLPPPVQKKIKHPSAVEEPDNYRIFKFYVDSMEALAAKNNHSTPPSSF